MGEIVAINIPGVALARPDGPANCTPGNGIIYPNVSLAVDIH